MNIWIAGQEVDAVWEKDRLAVELDSWGFHRGRNAFERDPQRSAALLVAGYRPLRITYRRLTTRTAEVVGELRQLLGDECGRPDR
jgi:very-short-patch-repair endonuclease